MDAQWRLLELLIPVKERRADGRARPPLEPRALVDGILWICRTGAPWAEMSSKHPLGSSCRRYFQGWVKDGCWDKVRIHPGGRIPNLQRGLRRRVGPCETMGSQNIGRIQMTAGNTLLFVLGFLGVGASHLHRQLELHQKQGNLPTVPTM